MNNQTEVNDESRAEGQSLLNDGLGIDININCIFGHKELKQFNKFERGKMVCYGYSITYDRVGKETSRTEPEAISSIGWDNGTPFTEADLKTLSA